MCALRAMCWFPRQNGLSSHFLCLCPDFGLINYEINVTAQRVCACVCVCEWLCVWSRQLLTVHISLKVGHSDVWPTACDAVVDEFILHNIEPVITFTPHTFVINVVAAV